MNSQEPQETSGEALSPSIAPTEPATKRPVINPLLRWSTNMLGLGIGAWAAVVPFLWLLSLTKIDVIYAYFMWDACYFGGIALVTASVVLAAQRESRRTSKVGLVLASLVLLAMIGFTFWFHCASGSWLWQPGAANNSGCGCGCLCDGGSDTDTNSGGKEGDN